MKLRQASHPVAASRPAPEPDPSEAWSLRSQASWLEQRRLEDDLRACEANVSRCEREIAKAKENAARLTESVLQGRPIFHQNLQDMLALVENLEREEKNYKEFSASLLSKIQALAHPTSPQMLERRKQQVLLSRLASERLEKDTLIDSSLKSLAGLLQARREITADMQSLAAALDMQSWRDAIVSRLDLDQDRFEALARSLPSDVGVQSERWVTWFLGRKVDTKFYCVDSDTLILPETLASSGFYRRGERIELTEEEARKLGSAVVPVDAAA